MGIAQARWLPGGDKYMEVIEDERRAFYDRVQAEQEEILGVLRAVVSTWTENEMDAGNEPFFQRFLDEQAEWDHEALYDIIEAEIERTKGLCLRG